MALISFTVEHGRAGDYQGTGGMDARTVLGRIANFIAGCASGAHSASEVTVGTVAASQTVTLSGADSEVVVYVGMGSASVIADGGDEATATALAAEFNAQTDLRYAFVAKAEGNVVTITSTCADAIGNHVAIAVTGTGISTGGDYLAGSISTIHTF